MATDLAASGLEKVLQRALDIATQKALRIILMRRLFLAILMGCGFILIAGRVVQLSLFQDPETSRHYSRQTALVHRANIVDRHNTLLATTLQTASLYADPKYILDVESDLAKISKILPDLPLDRLRKQLKSKRRFVWVKRNLVPKQQQEIHLLGLPGFKFKREMARVYPQGPLTSHLLGYVNVDGKGLAGLEKSYEKTLSKPASLTNPATTAFQLSLDLRVQHVVREELMKAMTTYRAKAASGIVMNVQNGEILSMVSLPDYDPHNPTKAKTAQKFQRTTLGVYELGSIFKIINSAIALETETASLNHQYDVKAPLRIGGFKILDYSPKNKNLSFPEVFKYSSNIGSALIAGEYGIDAQQYYLDQLGLLSQLPLNLPENGRPLTPDPWRQINMMTISYGHGIAVSPLHFVSALSTIVNNGIYHPPRFIPAEPEDLAQPIQVFSAKTSYRLRQLMRFSVTDGTGKRANARGYMVGGKTGSAEKPEKGGYNKNKMITSFAGAFPMNDPRYAFIFMLDEPKGVVETYGHATAGWVIAPASANIINRIGPLLGINPLNNPEAIDEWFLADIRPPS